LSFLLLFILSSTKLEIRAEQFLPGSKGVGEVKGGSGGGERKRVGRRQEK
jgi:hypothetical protein